MSFLLPFVARSFTLYTGGDSDDFGSTYYISTVLQISNTWVITSGLRKLAVRNNQKAGES
jgi:hypothetical protein